MQLSSKYAINGKVVLSLSFEEVFNVYSLISLFPLLFSDTVILPLPSLVNISLLEGKEGQ